MAGEWEEHEEKIEVPKGAGIPGLLKAVEGVVRLPRVKQIVISGNGVIEYSFFLRKGEEANAPPINFEAVMPYAAARNGQIVELPRTNPHAAVACGQLFEEARRDQMQPIAFLGGADSKFWKWYSSSINGEVRSSDYLFGLPFLTDRHMEDMALLLCTGYKRNGLITDTVKSYKITIPQRILEVT